MAKKSNNFLINERTARAKAAKKYLDKKKKKAEQQKGSANNGAAHLSKEQRLRQIAQSRAGSKKYSVKRFGAGPRASSGISDRKKSSSSTVADVTKNAVKRFGAGWAGAAVAMGKERGVDRGRYFREFGGGETSRRRGSNDRRTDVQKQEGQKDIKKAEQFSKKVKKTGKENLEQAKKDLEKYDTKLNKEYEKITKDMSPFEKWVTDLGSSGLQLAGDIGIGVATGGGAIPAMVIRAGGQNYIQARKDGATDTEAKIYGLLGGAVEGATEKIFPGSRAMKSALKMKRGIFNPKVLEKEAVAFTRSNFGKNTSLAIKKLGVATTTEGAEEFVAGIVQPALRKWIYSDEDYDVAQVLKDSLYDASIGAAIGGGFGAVDVGQDIKKGRDLRGSGGAIEGLVESGLASNENTKSHQKAKHIMVKKKHGVEPSSMELAELQQANAEAIAMEKREEAKRKAMQEAAIKVETGKAPEDRNMGLPIEVQSEIYKNQQESPEAEAIVSPSASLEKYNSVVEQATEKMRSFMPKAEEGAEVELSPGMESDIISIGKIAVGDAGIEDVAKLNVENQAARSIFSEITGIKLPDNNIETKKVVNAYITDMAILYAKNDVNYENQTKKTEIIENIKSDYKNSIDDAGVSDLILLLNKTKPSEYDATALEYLNYYIAGKSTKIDFKEFSSGKNKPMFLSENEAIEVFNRARGRTTPKVEKSRSTVSKQADSGFKNSVNKSEKTKNIDEKMEKALDTVSKLFGVKVELVDTIPTGHSKASFANGYYSNGTIKVANNSDKPLGITFSHELWHHLKATFPKEAARLEDFVKNTILKDSPLTFEEIIQERIKAYKDVNQTLTEADAFEEVMADKVWQILSDPKLAKALAENNRSLAQKILDFIKEFIDAISSIFADIKEEADFFEMLGIEKEVVDMMADIIKSSVAPKEKISSSEKTKTTKKGKEETKYSISAELDKGLRSVLDNTFPKEKSEVYIGTSSRFLTNIIGAKQLRILMAPNKAYAAMVSEEKAKAENRYDKRLNYHNLGKDKLIQALESSENPIAAVVSKDESGNKKRVDRILLITDVLDDDGNNIVVVEQIDSRGTIDNRQIDANRVITVFGKEYINGVVKDAIASDTILHYDKNKISTITLNQERQTLNRKSSTYFSNNINNFWANVNWEKQKDGKVKKYSLSDKKYLEAVESGDMEAAQKMVDQAAKETGYTIKAYHGTGYDFTVFDEKKQGENYSTGKGGFFFTSKKETAKNYAKTSGGGKVASSYLRIENPHELEAPDGDAIDFYDRHTADILPEAKYVNENDGIIVHGDKRDLYVVFNPQQIKSADPVVYDDSGKAIPLSERFNPKSEDIRYSVQYGKTSLYTEDRLDYLLRAFAASNPDYAQAYITYIGPEDFLQLTTSTTGIEAIKKQTWPLDAENLKEEWQPIFLDVEQIEGNQFAVTGHEGRHRMSAMANAGITKAPVLMIDYSTKYSKKPFDLIELTPQKFGKATDRTGAVYIYDVDVLSTGNKEALKEKYTKETLSQKYSDKETLKFSLKDSEGNKLSKQQAEFFKDSKVRKNGKLLPVYHGTPAENITIFDPEKSDDSISLFFTDNEELASTFGKEKYKLYLNLKNPLTIDGNGSEWHRIRGKNKNTFKRELQDFRINTDYDKYEGEEIFTFSFTGEIEKGSPVSAEYLDEEGMASFLVEDLGMEENVVEELIGQAKVEAKNVAAERNADDGSGTIVKNNYEYNSTFGTTREWALYAKENNYDGVIFTNIYDGTLEVKGNVYVAFNPNQVKSIENKTPTNDSDIRYSLKGQMEMDLSPERFEKDFGISKKEAEIGSAAIINLTKTEAKSLSGNEIKDIGIGIREDLINKGTANLYGRKIRGAYDLAQIAQVYRNPQFETLRYIFLNGKNEVVFQTGITSRLPTVSFVADLGRRDEYWIDLGNAAKKAGAESFYMLHNHPSGVPEPSINDRLVTEQVASFFLFSKFLSLKEHIIINHNKFSIVTDDGKWQDEAIYSLGGVSKDELLTPSLDNALLGIKIKNADHLARVAKALEQDENQSVAIYIDSKTVIRGIQEISTPYLKKIGVDKAGEVFRESAVRFGCPTVFAITEDNALEPLLTELVRGGVLIDAMISDNSFRFDKGVKPEPKADFFMNKKITAERVGPDVRFSLSSPVEETKDLIAVHNLREEALIKALELGGFPMPSIAVTKARIGHDNFGEISVLFDKSTIDPKTSRYNKVYSSDAWTPTYPTIEHKINQKKAEEIIEKVNHLIETSSFKDHNVGRASSASIESYLLSGKSEKDIASIIGKDLTYKAAFLADIGVDIPVVYREKFLDKIQKRPNNYIVQLSDELSDDDIADMGKKDLDTARAFELKSKIAKIFSKKYEEKMQEEAPSLIISERYKPEQIDLTAMLSAITAYRNIGPEGVEREIDGTAILSHIDQEVVGHMSEFALWRRDLFDGIIEKSGIRKDIDYLTPSGRRRSFEKMHMDETLENAVKYMRTQKEKGDFIHPTILAATVKSYKSIKSIKDHAHLLEIMDEDEYDFMRDYYQTQFENVAVELIGDDSVGEEEAGMLLTMAFEKYPYNKEAMATYIKAKGYRWVKESAIDDVLDDFLDIVKETEDIPTRYFEAKPRRAVTLDEVVAVIAPEFSYARLKPLVEEKGLEIIKYSDADDDIFKDRLDVVNRVADEYAVKFSLQTDTETRRLQREKDRLKERVSNLRKEMQLSKGLIPDQKQINVFINRTRDSYRSKIKPSFLEKELKAIYKQIHESKKDKDWDAIVDRIQVLAEDVVNEGVWIDQNAKAAYHGILSYFKTLRVYVPESIRKGMQGSEWNIFRKENFNWLHVSNDPNDRDVDNISQELAAEFPGEFPGLADMTDEDQLYEWAEVVNDLKNASKVSSLSSYEEEELISDLTVQILDSLEDMNPHKTFADKKQEEKIAAVKAEREKVKAEREKVKARIEKIEADKKEALRIARLKGKERLEAMAERQRKQRAKERERKAKRALIENIKTHAEYLSSALLTNTEQKHVPEEFKQGVAKVLMGLNFENAATDRWAKKHGVSKRVMNLRALQSYYERLQNSEEFSGIEIDQGMTDAIRLLADIVDDRRLSDLSVSELEGVKMMMQYVRHQVSYANNAFNENIKQGIAELGDAAIAHELQKKEKHITGGVAGFFKDYAAVSNAKAADFFDRIGGPLQTLYNEIAKAQDRHIINLEDSIKYIEDLKKNINKKQDLKQWSEGKGKPTEIKLESGETIKLLPSQVMSLYALMKRPQAQQHIFKSGIVIAAADTKIDTLKVLWKGRKLNEHRINLTYNDIIKIVKTMNKDQLRVAETLLSYLNSKCKDWGNETSMKMFGIRKFEEDNYFPIQSSDMYVDSRNNKDIVPKLKNAGPTKPVMEFADNPIVIADFFDVITRHINYMSQYNSFVPVITDLERVFNYRSRGAEGYTGSVKAALLEKEGRHSMQYIERLLTDINSRYAREMDHTVMDWAIRRWKAATIGANIRVFVQQPSSIVRASMYISHKYLWGATAKRLGPGATATRERMWEICPIAQYKHWGFSQTDISRNMKDIIMGNDNWWNKAIFGIYGWADDIAWVQIFGAVEEETKHEYPELVYDSPEYRKHVNERFRFIVDRTQVVDSVLHRSQFMRNQDVASKSVTAFMAEPTTTNNMIMTAANKAMTAYQEGNKKEAAVWVAKGGQAVVLQAVVCSLLASLISTLRQTWTGDDDDDEKKDLPFLEQWLKVYALKDFGNIMNPFNMLPVVRDVVSLFEGYSVERTDMIAIGDLIKAGKDLYGVIDKEGTVKYSKRYLVQKFAEAGSAIFGIPAKTITRDMETAIRTVFWAMKDKEYYNFLEDKWKLSHDMQTNGWIFEEHYVNIKEAGDEEKANIVKTFLEENKVSQEDIDNKAKSMYGNLIKTELEAGNIQAAKDIKKRYIKYGATKEDAKELYLSKAGSVIGTLMKDTVEEDKVDMISRMKNIIEKGEKWGLTDDVIHSKVKTAFRDGLVDSVNNLNAAKTLKILKREKLLGIEMDESIEYVRNYLVGDIFKEAVEKQNRTKQQKVESYLLDIGMSKAEVYYYSGNRNVGYYDMLIYNAKSKAEARRLANEVYNMYPNLGSMNPGYTLEYVFSDDRPQSVKDMWKSRKWKAAGFRVPDK